MQYALQPYQASAVVLLRQCPSQSMCFLQNYEHVHVHVRVCVCVCHVYWHMVSHTSACRYHQVEFEETNAATGGVFSTLKKFWLGKQGPGVVSPLHQRINDPRPMPQQAALRRRAPHHSHSPGGIVSISQGSETGSRSLAAECLHWSGMMSGGILPPRSKQSPAKPDVQKSSCWISFALPPQQGARSKALQSWKIDAVCHLYHSSRSARQCAVPCAGPSQCSWPSAWLGSNVSRKDNMVWQNGYQHWKKSDCLAYCML